MRVGSKSLRAGDVFDHASLLPMNCQEYINSLKSGLFQFFMQRHLNRIAKGSLLERFEQLTKIASIVVPEYRFKWPQVSWWNTCWFSAYLEKFGEDKSFNADRRWMVYQLMQLVSDVPGDTAECGAYKGAASWLICKANEEAADGRTHYVFDSFKGLSKPNSLDGTHWREGDLSIPLNETRQNLAEYDRLVFLEGWIPSRFREVESRKFSFVHIDVDLYEPTLQSIDFFYERLAPGAIMLCDDYGFDTCPGATKAMDEFFCGKPEAIVSLCSGGGFIIKANPRT